MCLPPSLVRIVIVCGVLLSGSIIYAREPYYQGLGSYRRKVATDSPQAQRYFNQGLAWLQGFNDAAAIRAFREAANLDPACAMAHWGIALAAGPNINNPDMTPEMVALARKELTLARCSAHVSEVERTIIKALGRRYKDPLPGDTVSPDQIYADAMRRVWNNHPNDPDVGAFFAEALMDVRPWDQWTREGQPNPGTEEIIATLDSVLRLDPNHPLANHLYIHALEASPHPERADAAADKLRNLQPGNAHLLHMPSHIDVHCGRWQQAIVASENAVKADKRYRESLGKEPLGTMAFYAAHDQHMLVYAALMTGQGKLALQHSRELLVDLGPEFLRENALAAESFAALPIEVMMRFGQWDDILAESGDYPEYMPYTHAIHHAARAIAFAAKHEAESARKEQALMVEIAQLIPKKTVVGENNAGAVLSLMQSMVEGEILVAEGKIDQGLQQLRTAAASEDALSYDEPPSWMIPVRHTLGANLIKAGRFAEAEQVYREDLRRVPENGWSLFGLSDSLRRQGKDTPETAAITARFQRVWAQADLTVCSSCLCQPNTEMSTLEHLDQ